MAALLDDKIREKRLPISPRTLGKMSDVDKRRTLKTFSRFDHTKNKTEQIWKMADSHAGLFRDLDFSNYKDFVAAIVDQYKHNFRGGVMNESQITSIGYRILQTHFVKKIEEIERIKKKKSLYVDHSFFQERLDYFKSDKFIQNLSSTIPERTDLENQTDRQSGYQLFLSRLFETSDLLYRPIMEAGPDGTAIQANRQCQIVLGTTARTITLPQNPTNCYICGLPIRPIDKERGFKTAECEHLLPVLIAIIHIWICKSPNISDEDRELLKNEYKWSHMCCNRIKTNLSLIEFNNLAPSQNSYYFSERRARQLLNIIFDKATTAAATATAQGTPGKGVPWSDCLQVYHGLRAHKADVLVSNQRKRQWIEDRVKSLSTDFSKITAILNNTRIAGNIIASMQLFGIEGLQKLDTYDIDKDLPILEKAMKDLYSRYKIVAAMSRDFLNDALFTSEAEVRRLAIVANPGKFKLKKIQQSNAKKKKADILKGRRKLASPSSSSSSSSSDSDSDSDSDSSSGRGILKKNIINNKKLIKKELQKSKSKLKKLLDIGNRLKLELDYRNKKYDTKNDDNLFNFKLNYMRKSLGNEILDSIKNITNKKSLYNWIDEMFLKIKNLPKDTKEFETSVKKNHKQLSQVDDKVKIFNIKDKKNKAKGIKKKKYIVVNIKLYPKLKTVPKLAFIPISLVSSKILTSLNKLNIENYKLIELKTSVSNDLSYFLIEFNLDIDKKYDKNLINSQIKNLFNNESFLLDINENSISSFPIFDKVKVSISNLNNKTKNKHSRGKSMRSKGKGMRSKGMRIRKAKGIRKTNKNKKTKKTKKKRKN